MPQRLKRRSEVEPEGSPEPTRQRREESTEVSEAEAEETDTGDATTSGPPPIDLMVKKFVRLALATEFTRQPLRRTDISTKVLEPHNRMFRQVFKETQKALQQKFGMRLVELPSKEKVTLQQKRAAQRTGAGASQSGSNTSNKSWILTSTLPASLRAAAILAPSRNPNATSEAEYVGLYSFVVSLVYLSQGSRISEGKLERYLARCNAGEYVPGGEKTENVLKKMEKQGYIIKIRDREPGGEETIDWILGPRGKVEIGEKGVAGLVKDVYAPKDNEMEGLEDRLERSLGVGAFKRNTRRGGEEEEEEEGDQEGEGETQEGIEVQEVAQHPAQRRRSARGQPRASASARRSSGRSVAGFIDGAAEEDDEETEEGDEDEEEEEEEDEEEE